MLYWYNVASIFPYAYQFFVVDTKVVSELHVLVLLSHV